MPVPWLGHHIILRIIRQNGVLVIPTGMAQRAAAQLRLGIAIASASPSKVFGVLRFRVNWSQSPLSAHRSWRRSASCWALIWTACSAADVGVKFIMMAVQFVLFPMKSSDRLAAEVVQ